MSEPSRPRRLGRSATALLAGFVVGVVLSLGTDIVLHATGVFPPWGRPMSDSLFALATAYRTVYNVVACYVIARLAPDRPMRHALIGGAVGVVVSLLGAAATWNNPDFGPHWYPLALAISSLPCAWLGGRLFERRITTQPV